jgi:phenylacetate-CoA ligase
MGLDFKIREFSYPLQIWKLKKEFNRNQWLSEKELTVYQLTRLQTVLKQAFENVSYYRELLQKTGIDPGDITSLSAFRAIPCLSKDDLRKNFRQLSAHNFKKFHPRVITTSGTTGGQVKFYADKPSNILEFVFYWRFWGWGGYRLGNRFAELSAQFFTPFEKYKTVFSHLEPLTGRLMVNSLLISRENIDVYIQLFKKFRPLFIKGLPSNLYCLALLLHEKGNHDFTFKAVFSQGENLLQYQRNLIEQVFNCRVLDYYGHMERTMAISQCEHGSYHCHMDYGLIEFEKNDRVHSESCLSDEYIAEVIGTSLHNYSMPLIRYRTGDYVTLKKDPKKCACGRGFPTVASILGRDCDIVYTSDGRAITALYVVFDRTPGLGFGQIVQRKAGHLLLRVVIELPDKKKVRETLLKNVISFTGQNMNIEIEDVDPQEVKHMKTGKFRVVKSLLKTPFLD